MIEVLKLFAFNGITTIRGMLGHPKHLDLRTKIQNGEILGPRLYTSGPSFSGLSVKSPEMASDMVRKQKEMGYDFLKLHPGLTKENFSALVKTAQEVGISYGGHISFGVGLWMACDAHYATIDHLDGMVEALVPGIEKMTDQQAGLFGMFVGDQADKSLIPKVIQKLKENNIWVVPTQALAERWFDPAATPDLMDKAPEMIYMDSKTRNSWIDAKINLVKNPQYKPESINNYIKLRRSLILECQKNGVGILLGSDGPQVFNVPGFSVHHELKYLVTCGLTPFQALQTGTVNVSRFYQANDRGMIKTGYVADLVLLNGNPLEDISKTQAIEGVMLNGKWMDKGYLTEEFKKLEKK